MEEVLCKEGIIFRDVKRIVIKVGTSVITAPTGRLDSNQLKNLVDQIAQLWKKGYQVVLVTSGAIAAGVERLGMDKRPAEIPELQAAASVGQGLLLHQYATLFSHYGLKVGQVLLTQVDTTHRQQYLNARNTLNKLLELGVTPIVNENDATAVDEIKFGDNDTLAALVTNLVQAELLIILSDIAGFYTGDPRKDKEVKILSEVETITPEIEELAGGVGTKFSLGGMVTKIQAARIVTFAQAGMIIADGMRSNVLLDIMDGKEIGTFFKPQKKKVASRKLWIAFGKKAKGALVLDDGAKVALIEKGKSLLPAGIIDVDGEFSIGDSVNIVDKTGKIFAKGLTNFSSDELLKIKGLKSSEVVSVLSEDASEEVIHRDYLVILER